MTRAPGRGGTEGRKGRGGGRPTGPRWGGRDAAGTGERPRKNGRPESGTKEKTATRAAGAGSGGEGVQLLKPRATSRWGAAGSRRSTGSGPIHGGGGGGGRRQSGGERDPDGGEGTGEPLRVAIGKMPKSGDVQHSCRKPPEHS